MLRRDFITLLGGVAATWPIAAHGQPSGKVPRVGVLWHATRAEEEKGPLIFFRQGLKDFGYIDGQNIILEQRFPNEEPELFKKYADELVALQPDVLAAVTRPAALAAKRATTTIPTVFVVVPDPLGGHLVKSLAHPEGNMTGLSTMAVDLTGKRFELLKEIIPDLSRCGLLVNMHDPEGAQAYIDAGKEASVKLGVSIQSIGVQSPRDFDDAFAAMTQANLQGVVLMQDGLFYAEQKTLAELALRHRIPLIAFTKELAKSGMFMSYGPRIPEVFRRAGYFIDRILKGAKPQDLPVEQPAIFEFSINLKTAVAMGISVSPIMLSRADEVIE